MEKICLGIFIRIVHGKRAALPEQDGRGGVGGGGGGGDSSSESSLQMGGGTLFDGGFGLIKLLSNVFFAFLTLLLLLSLSESVVKDYSISIAFFHSF